MGSSLAQNKVAGQTALACFQLMDEESSKTLELLWKSGRVGNLSPLEQLKAVVYRDVLLETGSPKHGLNSTIAKKLKKVGGGDVTRQAVDQHCSV